MRISMMLDDKLLAELDSYCEKIGVARTHAISSAIYKMLKEDKLQLVMTDYLSIIGKAAASGDELTDEQKQTLDYYRSIITQMKED